MVPGQTSGRLWLRPAAQAQLYWAAAAWLAGGQAFSCRDLDQAASIANDPRTLHCIYFMKQSEHPCQPLSADQVPQVRSGIIWHSGQHQSHFP